MILSCSCILRFRAVKITSSVCVLSDYNIVMYKRLSHFTISIILMDWIYFSDQSIKMNSWHYKLSYNDTCVMTYDAHIDEVGRLVIICLPKQQDAITYWICQNKIA